MPPLTVALAPSPFTWTRDPASDIAQRFIEANGQTFELAECGSRERQALVNPLERLGVAKNRRVARKAGH